MEAVVITIGLLLLVLNQPPLSKVVLLPDADGSTGSVIVNTGKSEQLLSNAYGSASVDRQGSIAAAAEQASVVTKTYAQTLAARPAPPVSFTLFFEFGSAVDITPSFQPVLEQLRAALPSYPAAEITVIGHTDRVGTLESNDTLSMQRAQTVRDLLIQAGIPAASIEVAGRGEREPIVPTADEVPETKNRRVEINLR